MTDERRTMGSRTGDSKKELECGICTNPPFPLETSWQALQVLMVALLQCTSSIMLCIYIFLVKNITSVHEFLLFLFVGLNFQQYVLRIFVNFRFYAHLSQILRCRDLRALSGKFLREKSCCPESFCFF